jgi:hypothetical protein
VILAAALVFLGVVTVAALVLLAVALGDGNDASNTASRSTAPPTTSYSLPTVATVRGQVLMSFLVRVHMSVAGQARSLEGTTSV